MVLKIVSNREYEITDSTEKIIGEEIIYRGNIKDIKCFYPLNSNKTVQSLIISYLDGKEEYIVIGEYNKEKEIYEPTHKCIFLMNDEGKTIEKIA